MKKTINRTTAALERVMQEKREWLATANSELDTAITLEKNDTANYWRDQIARTHGAIAALEEVAEVAVNSFDL